MGSPPADPSDRRLRVCNLLPAAIVICIILFGGSAFVLFADNERIPAWLTANFGETNQTTQSHICERQHKPVGSESLPEGIISPTSDLEMEPLLSNPERKGLEKLSKSLLAIPVGIKQKEVVNKIVTKFPSANFTVMLFHYDGIVGKWRDLQWSDTALHVSAISQTKWWFAKRFLHPDIVADYKYIFLWDEDLEVENFHPLSSAGILIKCQNDFILSNMQAPPGSATSNDQARQAMKKRSYAELDIFTKRWQHAVVKDKCWTDPYPE